MDPYPQARIDVSGLAPAAAHAKIVEYARTLLVVDAAPNGLFPQDVLDAASDQWAGVISLLERHAPDTADNRDCAYSQARATIGDDRWPCPDYRDASRGIAVGLPTETDVALGAAARHYGGTYRKVGE